MRERVMLPVIVAAAVLVLAPAGPASAHDCGM